MHRINNRMMMIGYQHKKMMNMMERERRNNGEPDIIILKGKQLPRDRVRLGGGGGEEGKMTHSSYLPVVNSQSTSFSLHPNVHVRNTSAKLYKNLFCH
jgi:hypothetical protein